MKIIYTLIKLVVLIALLLLAISNTQTVTFSYLPGHSVDLSLIILLLVFFVIGAVAGVMALFGRLLQLRNHVNQLQAKIKKEQEQNAQLQLQSSSAQNAHQPVLTNTKFSDQK